MAKNSITDYSKTAASNTDIQSVDIDEGCLPSGINNAIRELMADLADMNDGTVTLTSPSFAAASLTGDLSFSDNDKAIFGAGNDLQIYHDGNNSIIKDAGTGSLVINTNTFQLANAANTETILNAVENGAVTLYYDNATKLATTSTGIDVTGTVTADGLTVSSGSNQITLDTGDQTTYGRLDVGHFSNGAFIGTYAGTNAAANILRFGTSGTERMRIDSSGNVGIGDSSPLNASGYTTLSLNDTTGSLVDLRVNDGDAFRIQAQSGSSQLINIYNQPMSFHTNDTERMRIDSSGNLLVGTTSQIEGSKVCISAANGLGVNITGAGGGALNANYVSTGTGYFGYFKYNGTVVGSITSTGSSTAYNTSSDYRLKENVTGITDGIERVKQLNPSRFNFIADADTTVDGFLAHEAATVVPEAVTGEKDAMRDEEYEVTPAVLDDDGNVVTEAVMGTRSVPDYQGIDQAKLVPLLTAALQEAITKIEDLEARVATLEGN